MTLPLINAVKAIKLEEVKRLLQDLELDVNFRLKTAGIDGEITALHMAAAKGYIDIIFELLAHPKIQPNSLTSLGRTAIHAAAIYGQVETCKILLSIINPAIKDRLEKLAYNLAKEKSAQSINSQDTKKYLETLDTLIVPTFVACCESGDIDAVKFLIQEKVDVNLRFRGTNGLFTACKMQHLEIVNYLLTLPGIENKLIKEFTDEAGNNFVSMAILNKKFNLAESLIAKVKFNLNSKNINGDTPLTPRRRIIKGAIN